LVGDSTPIFSGPPQRPVDGPFTRELPVQRPISLFARPLRSREAAFAESRAGSRMTRIEMPQAAIESTSEMLPVADARRLGETGLSHGTTSQPITRHNGHYRRSRRGSRDSQLHPRLGRRYRSHRLCSAR
jgi:hypothetical protein